MAVSLLQNGMQTFLDANGDPLAMGTVEFCVPGTTDPKDTWQDSAKTMVNTNPVKLDAAGRALIYGDGQYRQVVRDTNGNLIWDQLTESDQDSADANALTTRIFDVPVIPLGTVLTTGDGKAHIRIVQEMDDWLFTGVSASLLVSSSSGDVVCQVRKSTGTGPTLGSDMLSTPITIPALGHDSILAGAQPVIDGTNNVVRVWRKVLIDIDSAGTGAEGLNVQLIFSPPT